MASLIGKEIDKYRITERIGRGGMAEVYLGIHIHLDRPRAIKVLHGHLLEGGDFIERFKREAKAVANLRHSNIVQVYDLDIQDDIIFMVMEYIDGTNLQKRLVELDEEGERFPIKQIGSIINDIAGALDYAHSQGMLHRDVKPSNILIDEDGKAYLADFGIARIISDQKLTANGTLIGTPAYMSPEQGRGDELTEESDIYSLGIVAFEMLTGQVPYDAQTPIGIVHKQISEPVPDMAKLVDGVPVSAQEVIDRALAKSPEGRYSSAEELVSALRIALEGRESTEIDEEILSAPTVVIQDVSAPDEFDQPIVLMEEDKAPEQQDEASPPEKKTEKAQAAAKKSKRKIPTWGVITAGVALVGIAAVVLTQVIDLRKPESESEPIATTAPEPVESPVEPVIVYISTGEEQVSADTPTRTSLPPTRTPSPTPIPPTAWNFYACLDPCKSDGSNALTSFPKKTTKIYLRWNYEGFYQGAHYERIWTMEGNEWGHYDCTWPGPSSGVEDSITLTESSGLKSGVWVVRLVVDGETVMYEEITIKGNWNFWDPAGYFDTCYGKH